MDTRQPRCMFSVRYPAGDGKWRYQSVDIPSPGGSAFVPMQWPPSIGDLISLWGSGGPEMQPLGGPIFQVIYRLWNHSSWGSASFPYGKTEPDEGPLVDIIVEPAEGPYRDETPICGESTCEAVWVNGAWWTPPGADEPDPHEHVPYRVKD